MTLYPGCCLTFVTSGTSNNSVFGYATLGGVMIALSPTFFTQEKRRWIDSAKVQQKYHKTPSCATVVPSIRRIRITKRVW